MIHRFLFSALGVYFIRISIISLVWGIMVISWWAIGFGIVEGIGAVVLMMIGTLD
jgi:hypothetical protein